MSRTIELGEVTYPAKWEICSRCDGEGTHVNPSIDGHGISAHDEIWDDEEFHHNYFSGVYDVQCYDCGGAGKQLVVDEDACTPEQLEEVIEHYQSEYEYEQMSRMERMYGA